MKLSRSYRIYLVLLISGLLLGQISLQGQIYSNSANTSKPIKYYSYDGVDKLFVFYQTQGAYRPGSLSVNGTEAGTFDFEWTKYDHNADAFSIAVKNDIGVASSTINNLNEGGYKVRITNGVDVDTTFTGWVMLDNFFVGTEDDGAGNIKWGKSGCPDGGNYLIINGIVEADSFFYYDPVTHVPIPLINDYEFTWTSDNAELEIFGASRYLDNTTNSPPVEDTYYILTATDSLGMTEVDSVFYDTKFTRAEYTLEYFDKINNEFDPDLTESWSLDVGSLDAPLTVKFINDSKNGSEFTWVFLDTINEITMEATKVYEEISNMDYEPEFTYYNAGKYYYPYLVSISDVGCVDTFSLEDGIRVVPSQLAIPNVFSPNKDDKNDIWIFKHQSLKECRITIIDKFGKVIYKRKIEDIYEWDGWGGTVLNSDRPAPEGQYYYVVEGVGFDNVIYEDPNVFERRKIEKQIGETSTTTTGTDTPTQSSSIYTGWLYLFKNSGEY